MKVFLAYGFARTTMDDIARAADMSRPALYLLFRNKGQIYRAIAATMLEDSLLKADRALSSREAIGDASRPSSWISAVALASGAPLAATMLAMSENDRKAAIRIRFDMTSSLARRSWAGAAPRLARAPVRRRLVDGLAPRQGAGPRG